MGRLIESEQLKKAVRENYGSALDSALICRFIDDYAETVAAEPVKHGHWKKCVLVTNTEDPEKSYWIVKCSLCCLTFEMKHTYCPNCGAKMDEPAEVGHGE